MRESVISEAVGEDPGKQLKGLWGRSTSSRESRWHPGLYFDRLHLKGARLGPAFRYLSNTFIGIKQVPRDRAFNSPSARTHQL
ncbi:g4965 [Coccomyxa elongata]